MTLARRGLALGLCEQVRADALRNAERRDSAGLLEYRHKELSRAEQHVGALEPFDFGRRQFRELPSGPQDVDLAVDGVERMRRRVVNGDVRVGVDGDALCREGFAAEACAQHMPVCVADARVFACPAYFHVPSRVGSR